jgi:general secretion pathway protein G
MKENKEKGFTIIELLAVITIISILSSLAFASFRNSIKKAKIAKAISDISIIYKSIILYETDNDKLPDTLEELSPTYLRKIPLDPWGEKYQYLNFAISTIHQRKDGPIVPINTKFDLYSKGENRKTTPNIRSVPGRDDIILANDGEFIGLAEDF